jgi:hypothetical protein
VRALLALAAALGAATLALAFRRRARGGLRLDVYYDDGAMLSLAPVTPEATAALARATDALAAAGRP